ncbi:MAG: hypothetical protein G01um101470_872, partial [Parcubacteria group bacterium Gr01-1014_70]
SLLFLFPPAQGADGIRGRAMHRGLQIRVPFAEAFEIVKVKDDTSFFHFT